MVAAAASEGEWRWVVVRPGRRGGAFLAHSPVLVSTNAAADVGDVCCDDLSEDDPGRAEAPSFALWGEHSVVYSVAYQTPALYVSFWEAPETDPTLRRRSDGGGDASAREEAAVARIQRSTSAAQVTRGEHPVHGAPCWFLHPCGTARFMAELGPPQEYLSCWLSWAGPLVALKI